MHFEGWNRKYDEWISFDEVDKRTRPVAEQACKLVPVAPLPPAPPAVSLSPQSPVGALSSSTALPRLKSLKELKFDHPGVKSVCPDVILSEGPVSWTCQRCTLVNDGCLTCQACGFSRPRISKHRAVMGLVARRQASKSCAECGTGEVGGLDALCQQCQQAAYTQPARLPQDALPHTLAGQVVVAALHAPVADGSAQVAAETRLSMAVGPTPSANVGSSIMCGVCQERVSSAAALRAHIRTPRHRQLVELMTAEDDEEIDDGPGVSASPFVVLDEAQQMEEANRMADEHFEKAIVVAQAAAAAWARFASADPLEDQKLTPGTGVMVRLPLDGLLYPGTMSLNNGSHDDSDTGQYVVDLLEGGQIQVRADDIYVPQDLPVGQDVLAQRPDTGYRAPGQVESLVGGQYIVRFVDGQTLLCPRKSVVVRGHLQVSAQERQPERQQPLPMAAEYCNDTNVDHTTFKVASEVWIDEPSPKRICVAPPPPSIPLPPSVPAVGDHTANAQPGFAKVVDMYKRCLQQMEQPGFSLHVADLTVAELCTFPLDMFLQHNRAVLEAPLAKLKAQATALEALLVQTQRTRVELLEEMQLLTAYATKTAHVAASFATHITSASSDAEVVITSA